VLLAVVGAASIAEDPGVVAAASPTYALAFIGQDPLTAFVALGSVVLAVTGAEALYADRGHFGAGPIRMGWFGLALPALMLNYLGQGAFILHHPALAHTSTFNPFYQMAPHWTLWPLVVLAALATVIASQAAISGSFSVAKQAVQLGFLPRLRVLHTSPVEGQIYVPIVNWALCIGVIALTLVFRSAAKLGDIYGVAVTGTFILNTLLFVAVARLLWGTTKAKVIPLAVLFLTVEIAFFSANIAKIEHGAWLSLAIGLAMSIVMINWRRGQVIVTRNRMAEEGPLDEFLDGLAEHKPPVVRVPGVAVFLTRDIDTTPLALREEIEHTHCLHEKVVLVTVDMVSIPHVDAAGRFMAEMRGRGLFKVFHITMRVGYHDRLDVPEALALARKGGLLDRNLDLEHASYFVSRIAIAPTDDPGMAPWRKKLFITMARNATTPVDHFGLPSNRTVMMGSQVPL
jgi:KUP system potassium uptake protein